jgi:hypothetical protein
MGSAIVSSCSARPCARQDYYVPLWLAHSSDGVLGVKPTANRTANALHERASAFSLAARFARSRGRCQGRRGKRLALGIRFSVCIAVIAEALRFLAGAAVRRLAPSTISLAEVAAA